MIKRMIGIVLLMSILVSSVQCAFADNDNSDINGKDWEEAVSVLSALNILKISDSKFKPDELLTRAELAVIIVRMTGVNTEGEVKDGELPFTDIDSSYWAAYSILTVYKMGLLNGFTDGKFRPDDTITYEQTVKIITLLLGYEPLAQKLGGYPDGYILAAAQNGYRTGINVAMGTQVTHSMIAIMLYNALEAPVLGQTNYGTDVTIKLSNDQSILNNKLKIYRMRNQITANEDTALIGNSGVDKDQIKAGNMLFKAANQQQKELLGYYVDLYYKVDDSSGDNILIYARKVKNKNVELIVQDSDICDQTEENKFVYTKDSDGDAKTKTIELSLEKTTVIYNGRALFNYNREHIKPNCGSVKLLDYNSDGQYDILFVTSYQNYVVDKVNQKEHIIYDKYDSNLVLNLDQDNQDIKSTFYKNGKNVDFSSAGIGEWDILSVAQAVYENDDKQLYFIAVSNQNIAGKLEEIEADYKRIKIDEKVYDVSYTYRMYLKNNPISIGMAGTFYLDATGKIAAGNTGVDYRKNYGYLVKAQNVPGISGLIQMKIYTIKGEFEKFNCVKKVRVNGNAVEDPNHVIDKNGVPISLENQLVIYKLDDSGKIVDLETAAESIDRINTQEFSVNKKYNDKNAYSTYGQINSYYRYDTSTKVFVIPRDLNQTDLFSIGSLINDENNGKSIWVYDTDESYRMGIGVWYIEDTVSAEYEDQYILLIDKTTKVIENDTEMVKVWGYYKGKYQGFIVDEKAKQYLKTPSQANYTWISYDQGFLKKGNVVRFNVNIKGYISNIYRGFDYEKEQIYNNMTDTIPGYFEVTRNANFPVIPQRIWLYGEVKYQKSDVLVTNNGRVFPKASTNNIYVYNTANDKIYIGTMDDVQKGARIYLRKFRNTELEIVVYK